LSMGSVKNKSVQACGTCTGLLKSYFAFLIKET